MIKIILGTTGEISLDGYISTKEKTMKHKHAEWIKKWLDGEEVEYTWGTKVHHFPVESLDIFDNVNLRDIEFRVKPQPKPDVVMWAKADKARMGDEDAYISCAYLNPDGVYLKQIPNLKITYDGETGKPKSVELLHVD